MEELEPENQHEALDVHLAPSNWVKLLTSSPAYNRSFNIRNQNYITSVVTTSVLAVGALTALALLMVFTAFVRSVAMSPVGSITNHVRVTMALCVLSLVVSIASEERMYRSVATAFAAFHIVPERDMFYSREDRDSAWFDEVAKQKLHEYEATLCVRQPRDFDAVFEEQFQLRIHDVTWEMLATVLSLDVIHPMQSYKAVSKLKEAIERYIDTHRERFLIIWAVALIAIVLTYIFATELVACIVAVILTGACAICRHAVATASADACIDRDNAAGEIIYFRRDLKVYEDKNLMCYDHLNFSMSEYKQKITDHLVKALKDIADIKNRGTLRAGYADEYAVTNEIITNFNKVNAMKEVSQLLCFQYIDEHFKRELLRGCCKCDELFQLQFLQLFMLIGSLVITALMFLLATVGMKGCCPSPPCPGQTTVEELLELLEEEERNEFVLKTYHELKHIKPLRSRRQPPASKPKPVLKPMAGDQAAQGGPGGRQTPEPEFDKFFTKCGNPDCTKRKMCTCSKSHEQQTLRLEPLPGDTVPIQVRVDKRGRIMAPYQLIGIHGVNRSKVSVQQLVRKINCQKKARKLQQMEKRSSKNL